MPNFSFPGYPSYLKAAAIRLGRSVVSDARHVAALAKMADLCAQAAEADAAHVADILHAAGEFRDQIHVAYLAAEQMLSDLREATGIRPLSDPIQPQACDPIVSSTNNLANRPGPVHPPAGSRRPGRHQGRT